jgi:hypothetical protein
LSSDDITSIFTSCYALIRIRKQDYTSVFKASRMWLLLYCFVYSNLDDKYNVLQNKRD